MITGNKDFMKLIYEIQDITLMILFNTPGGWSNSHNIAFRVFDYDYHGCNVYTNGNALPMVQGMAWLTI